MARCVLPVLVGPSTARTLLPNIGGMCDGTTWGGRTPSSGSARRRPTRRAGLTCPMIWILTQPCKTLRPVSAVASGSRNEVMANSRAGEAVTRRPASYAGQFLTERLLIVH